MLSTSPEALFPQNGRSKKKQQAVVLMSETASETQALQEQLTKLTTEVKALTEHVLMLEQLVHKLVAERKASSDSDLENEV